MRNIVALICELIMDTGTWLSRSHANGHKNVSRRVNCYNEECAARECAANFSTVTAFAKLVPQIFQGAFIAASAGRAEGILLPLSVRRMVCSNTASSRSLIPITTHFVMIGVTIDITLSVPAAGLKRLV